MLSFIYQALASRVVFGAGSVEKVPEEIERLGATRVLLITTPGRSTIGADLAARLGSKAAGVFDRAAMHAPIEIVQQARAEAERVRADCCLAIGGGSTTGVAKGIAMASALPIVCIPTTYSGSEMTPVWGLTEGGVKKTGRDLRVQPKTVIYDPKLTISMPARLSVTSGMNAMAHCVEGLYAQDVSPIISLMAEEGIRTLAQSLPVVAKEPANIEARSLAFCGAWLSGCVLAAVGMALHHKLCHTLGGAFGLPHAETHTVLLPYAAAYNASAAPQAIERVARALSVKSAAQGLYDLAASMGDRLSLKSLGMKRGDLDRAAELATQNPYYNPRPLTKDAIQMLLEDAYEGRPPRA